MAVPFDAPLDLLPTPFTHYNPSQAAILYNLKLRHTKERPYTRTGDIVIAMNPYKWYHELYTEKKRNYYANRLVWELADHDPRAQMEPHVYEVSALSYKGLAIDHQDQSILVSGESGAGKTETVKICLNHIATTQRGQVPEGWFEDAEYDPVVQRVVKSNPLLEAFGNAKTRRNDNSSRFGKYLQLQFDKITKPMDGIRHANCGLVGSRCEVYLLEKNRVIEHNPEERTFHIFYQLLAAPDDIKSKFWSKLKGASKEDFKYVGHTNTTSIEGYTDSEHFEKTMQALDLVNVADDDLFGLFEAICVVMQLGNIGFGPNPNNPDTAVITTPEELKNLSDLMGVPADILSSAFTERTFVTRKEKHKVPLSPILAKEACDALAKEAYQKMFLWLTSQINLATEADPLEGISENDLPKRFGTIGLLDIFGFEVFDVNRFEQLCINYANEKLQQKFTEDIFINVQAEYEAQGIPLSEIWYDKNTDVLDLIEAGTGLLNLLNEECVRPKGNDMEFVQKALQINNNNPALIVNKIDRESFGVHHYAGRVMYDAEGFVSSNQDTLVTDLQEAAEKCNNFIIRQPRSEPVVSSGSSRRESNIVAPTVWTKYKRQLNNLMHTLRQTQSRYIRCIKPNEHKKPLICDHNSVVEQLQCAGVVAGITISRSVFPNCLDNTVVLARYSNLWDRKKYRSEKTESMKPEEQRACDCRALMTGALKPKEVYEQGRIIKAFVVGKTKTYFRAGALEWLESGRMKGLDTQAITLQRFARGWLARNAGNSGRRRKQFEAEQELMKAEIEKRRQERLAQEAAERKKKHLEEVNVLEKEANNIETMMKKSDEEADAKVDELIRETRKMKKEYDELREQLQSQMREAILEPRRMVAEQEKKIDQNKKLITFLKREQKKAQVEETILAEKVAEVRTKHDRVKKTNEDVSTKRDILKKHLKEDTLENEELIEKMDQAKKDNVELRDGVTKAQEKYMEVANGRLRAQKGLAHILTLIQENCKKADLVEECVVLALNCESNAKAIMASLDTEVSEPDLMLSDVSESETHHEEGLW